MTPRGTTVSLRYSKDEDRPKRWGVHWNEYREGFAGRPKQRAKFYATEAEAEEVRQRVQAELAGDAPVATTAPVPVHRRADTLAALAGFDYAYDRKTDRQRVGPQYGGWLKFVQSAKQAATVKNYKDCVQHYLAPPPGHPRYPGLGDLIISDTTSTMPVFHDYLEGLYEDGVSFSMRLRLKAALSAFCTYATLTGKLTIANPLTMLGKRIRKLDEVDVVAEANPFTGDEIARLFDQLDAVEADCWQVYFRFLFQTGVRVGEAAALTWDQVDLTARTAVIAASYSDAAGKDKTTKTYEKRTLKLNTDIVARLARWKVAQGEQFFRSAKGRSRYVFTTPRLARALPSGSMREVFARTLAACGLTGHTPHNFRDTFATSHLQRDWDKKLPWVSAQLGHKTPETTRTFYYKYRPTADADDFADDILRYGK